MDMKCPETEYERMTATPEMVEAHRFALSRSQDDLLDVMNDEHDFFGFRKEVVLYYLTYESARPLLNEEAKAGYDSGASTWPTITDPVEAYQDFLDYMQFAWGKAMDERGISATRSIDKLSTWMWLLGRDDIADILTDDDLYDPYGAPALIEACEALSIDVPDELRRFAKRRSYA